jgi:hypothetical protein
VRKQQLGFAEKVNLGYAKELEAKLEEIELSLGSEKKSTKLNAILAGVPEEKDITTIIWHALVGFVNAKEEEEAGFNCFRASTHLCCLRLEEIFANPTEDLRCFDDVEAEYDRTRTPLENIFRSQASALRQKIRMVLVWLARPNTYTPAHKRYILEFLLHHGSEQAIQFGIDSTDKFDHTGRDGTPLFYWKNVYGYKTVFTPTAKFILDKLEQYHEGGIPLEKVIPLIICKRQECGRIAVVRRRTKDFCSNSCRTLYRQKNKPEVWAAYMRKYRSDSY